MHSPSVGGLRFPGLLHAHGMVGLIRHKSVEESRLQIVDTEFLEDFDSTNGCCNHCRFGFNVNPNNERYRNILQSN